MKGRIRRRGWLPRQALRTPIAIAVPLALLHISINAFSIPSSPPTSITATLIHPDSPTIVAIDNLLSFEEVSNAYDLIMDQCVADASKTTTDYQEDIFRAGAEQEEDDHFISVIQRVNGKININRDIPSEFCASPLKSFVWLASNHANALSEQDIVIGANYISRREARERWNSEGGKQLLDLSMDDVPFERAGRRYEMPNEMKFHLMENALPKILQSDEEGVSWTVKDATVVIYKEGEGQVPHIDPCDATLLVYLRGGEDDDRDGCKGGDTCFPLVGCRLPPKEGNALVFFSSTSPCQDQSAPSSAHGDGSIEEELKLPMRERDTMSLHHGGLVTRGEKVVAQIMLEAASIQTEVESWLDLVSIVPSV